MTFFVSVEEKIKYSMGMKCMTPKGKGKIKFIGETHFSKNEILYGIELWLFFKFFCEFIGFFYLFFFSLY